MLFVSQEERRASDTVLFTSENTDIANQSVDTSFFTSEKNRMTNQLASLARRDYFCLDSFWCVNLGMYIINTLKKGHKSKTKHLKIKCIFFVFVVVSALPVLGYLSAPLLAVTDSTYCLLVVNAKKVKFAQRDFEDEVDYLRLL